MHAETFADKVEQCLYLTLNQWKEGRKKRRGGRKGGEEGRGKI